METQKTIDSTRMHLLPNQARIDQLLARRDMEARGLFVLDSRDKRLMNTLGLAPLPTQRLGAISISSSEQTLPDIMKTI